MTRRITIGDYFEIKTYNANGNWYFIADTDDGDSIELKPNYQIGEEVAVAMNYKNVLRAANKDESVWQFLVEKGLIQSGGAVNTELITNAGYGNKMFVKAEYMPYRIIITDIKAERLQDISDEDCLKEGIMYDPKGVAKYGYWVGDGKSKWYRTPKGAFSVLIDHICGKGTWERNPWVFAYEFTLKHENK